MTFDVARGTRSVAYPSPSLSSPCPSSPPLSNTGNSEHADKNPSQHRIGSVDTGPARQEGCGYGDGRARVQETELTGRPSENEDGDDVLLKTRPHSAYKETRVIERWYSFQLGGVGGRGATQCSGTAAGPFKNSQQLREGGCERYGHPHTASATWKGCTPRQLGPSQCPVSFYFTNKNFELCALTANHAQMWAPHMVCGVCSPARKPPQKPHKNQWPSVRAAPNNTTGPPKGAFPKAPSTTSTLHLNQEHVR